MPTIAITGASGKLGGATLSSLLSLRPPSTHIIALTSSHPGSATWTALCSTAPEVRHASFDDPASFAAALAGVTTLFLVSTPRISMDFGGGGAAGREAHHAVAIDAAARAPSVRDVVYASLALAWDGSASDRSRAAVMRAHLRTEAYLRGGVRAAVLRQGLYAESWPLYLGYYDVPAASEGPVRVPADGAVCWTAIADLGRANAAVLLQPAAYAGRITYLSTRAAGARSVAEIGELVARARGEEVRVEIVGEEREEEVVRYYVEEKGLEEAYVRWWTSTYGALAAGEARVDDPTLERLLEGMGREPVRVEDVVERMVREGRK
ncbi:NAD(P)-binding protein [Camillea tinctor]|nr:NAD(P)-binding protein [Camillea tinctor]